MNEHTEVTLSYEFTRTLTWAVLGDVIEMMDMKTVENGEE